MLTVSECERYLQRIGYVGGVTPSIGNLQQLMVAHLTRIPFETVRLHRSGIEPDLDVGVLYERVVERGQGGYCFELNKLFQELLTSLGYEVRAAMARSTDTPGRVDPINHRGLIVYLDGKDHCADVGYGGPMPAHPLPLEVGTHAILGSDFIVERPREGWWVIDRISSKGERAGLMELSTFRVNEEDFDPLNAFCASVGSEFRDSEMANIRTRGGSVSLLDGKLTIREQGCVHEMRLADEELEAALKRYFGLDYRFMR